MYKRAMLEQFNINDIQYNLEEISAECDEIRYSIDLDNIVDALDGDEEQAFEFREMFSELSCECEQLYNILLENYITSYFDDFFVGISKRGQSCYKMVGFDSYEEDYFSLTSFDEQLAQNVSAQRIKRLNKDEILSVAGQCFGIAMAYLNVKEKYDNLKAVFDIIKGENGRILKSVKLIENLYSELYQDGYIQSDVEKKFEYMTKSLPDRLWVE